MLKEFKDFIAKGNVIDLAVAVVMATAFGAVVNTFVENIIMPIVGALTAGIDFSKLTVTIAGVEFVIGVFITAVINFIIIAFVMFLVVKASNKFKKAEEVEEAAPTNEELLLMEIRDLLKK